MCEKGRESWRERGTVRSGDRTGEREGKRGMVRTVERSREKFRDLGLATAVVLQKEQKDGESCWLMKLKERWRLQSSWDGKSERKTRGER